MSASLVSFVDPGIVGIRKPIKTDNQDDDDDDDNKKSSGTRNVARFLTVAAAVITALTGIFMIFVSLGYISVKSESEDEGTPTPEPTPKPDDDKLEGVPEGGSTFVKVALIVTGSILFVFAARLIYMFNRQTRRKSPQSLIEIDSFENGRRKTSISMKRVLSLVIPSVIISIGLLIVRYASSDSGTTTGWVVTSIGMLAAFTLQVSFVLGFSPRGRVIDEVVDDNLRRFREVTLEGEYEYEKAQNSFFAAAMDYQSATQAEKDLIFDYAVLMDPIGVDTKGNELVPKSIGEIEDALSVKARLAGETLKGQELRDAALRVGRIVKEVQDKKQKTQKVESFRKNRRGEKS